MSWRITPGWTPADSSAAAYIAAVEAADGQALENGVKVAIDNFVLGCKADGIWNAIKASCILAGARTLNGALVPLVGAAPTNYNFVSGDYNRKTGLVGNGSTKYLGSNRNNNADPQNSKHLSVYVSTSGSGTRSYVANISGSWLARDTSNFYTRVNQTSSLTTSIDNTVIGFFGVTRSSSLSLVSRASGLNTLSNISSAFPANESLDVFRKGDGFQFANDRLAFYSIGESLDLALLDARVTALVNAIAAALP